MIRYNNWANEQMIAHCRDLPADVLERVVPGVFGTIPHTLTHLIGTQGYFYGGVTGRMPEGLPQLGEVFSLEQLAELAARIGALWEAFADDPGDLSRPMVQGRGGITPPVIAPVTQIICHGSEHRAQVETILGVAGLEPPQFNPWVYFLREQ
jgi:uncharacterized damage-inducible protein DinB